MLTVIPSVGCLSCLSANTGTLSPAQSFLLSPVIISGSLQDISVGFINKSHGILWVLMPLLDTDVLSVGFLFFPWVLPHLSGTDAQPTCHCPFCWSLWCSPSADAFESLRVQALCHGECYTPFCVPVTTVRWFLIVLVWGSLARYIFSFYFQFLPSWGEGKSQVALDYTRNP